MGLAHAGALSPTGESVAQQIPAAKLLKAWLGEQRRELRPGLGVQNGQPLRLGYCVADHQRVLTLKAGQHNELFQGRAVSDVPLRARVGALPLGGRHAEQRFVEHVGLARINEAGIFARQLGRDQVRFHRVRVNPVLHFGQRPPDVPFNPFLGLRLLEPLEFGDQVELELRAQPRAKLESNVLVGEGTAVAASFGNNSRAAYGLGPSLDGQPEPVGACLKSNSVEFDRIKTGVVDAFPDAPRGAKPAVASVRPPDRPLSFPACKTPTPADSAVTAAATEAAQAFIQRWHGVAASELATSQSFVIELCALLGVEPPTHEPHYQFERPITFQHGDGTTSAGRVDCYKRGHFVWESKKLKPGAQAQRTGATTTGIAA